jgi:hypothetical protein
LVLGYSYAYRRAYLDAVFKRDSNPVFKRDSNAVFKRDPDAVFKRDSNPHTQSADERTAARRD